MVLQGILGAVLALTERICAKLNLEPDGDFEGPLKLPEEERGYSLHQQIVVPRERKN